MEASVPPDSDENEFDLEALKFKLRRCLRSLKSAGSFALFEQLPNAVSPGLYVKGVGRIGIPLSDRDANAITKAARGTPLGKLNVNHASAWELYTNNFETRNPHWQQVVNAAVQRVIPGLGIQTNGGTVTAELKRMQLFDKEALVDRRLSYHPLNLPVLGTLIICLPSKHEGGEIRFKYLGDTKTSNAAQYSELDISFMAWQSDAMCERSPVKSGYRLELVYRLHCTGGTVGYAGAETEGRAKLCRLITSWVTAYVLDEEVKLLVYRLRHPTTAELCYSALEGCDREIVQNLEKACSDAGSCLYLAHLEKKVLGTCNKGDWQYYQRLHPDKTYDDFSDELDEKQELQEVTEESITLTKVVNLNGTAVMQDIRIGEQEIIQKGLFERNPDEEYYKFSSATHHYRETVAVLATKRDQIPFILDKVRESTSGLEERNENMRKFLEELSRKMDVDPSNNEIVAAFEPRCRIVISNMKQFFAEQQPLYSNGAPFSGEVVGLLCTMSVRLSQKALFLDILSFDFLKMPRPSQSYPSFFQAIGMGLAVFGLEMLEPNLSTNINRVVSFSIRCTMLDLIAEGFKASKLRSRQLAASRSNFSTSANSNTGIPALEAIEDRSFSTWMEWHYRWALTRCQMRVDEDFVCLLTMGTILGTQFLLDDVIPVVKKYTSSSGLVIVFLEELLKAGEEEQFPHDIMLNAFREVFPNMLKDFSLRHAQDNSYQRQKTGQEKRRVAEGQGSPYLATSAKRSIENWKIASVLCKYLTLGLDSEFDQLISKILVETYAIPIGHYDEVLLPLLKVFLKILLEKEADLTKPRVRLLFQQGLAIYIDRYIRPEPRKPTDWTRYARECLCEYCVELNSFLLDPNMQQCRFTKNFGVRMHLQSQLSADEDDYKVETDMSSAAHTLVITKTSACSQYLRESIAWKSRSAAASQKIRSLGLGPLRELLGDQFDAIINLIWVKLGSGDQGDGRMSHTAQAPVEDPEVITIE